MKKRWLNGGWRKLAFLGAIALLLVFISSYSLGSKVREKYLPVWTQEGDMPDNLPVPEGFSISPAQARRNIWDHKPRPPSLSLKHHWVYYHDDKYYYVADDFLGGVKASNIADLGVKVDGRSGAVSWRHSPSKVKGPSD